MSFIRESLDQACAGRTSRMAHEIDLAPDEWEEVAADKSGTKADEMCAIVGFWALAMLLFAIVVATPALEAMAHHLT